VDTQRHTVPVIELTEPDPLPRSRRTTLRTLILAPVPGTLILVLVLALGAAAYAATRPPGARTYTVLASVSQYPADAVAQWRDTAGAAHTLDPWAAEPQQLPARSVYVVVVTDGAQCTLKVDSYVDTQTATGTAPAVCSWSVA
jgi:hypothetical protein